MIDVNGHQTDFTYDGKNRLLSATLSGLATSRTYTESGIQKENGDVVDYLHLYAIN